MKLAVIIPYYNGEEYIERCLQSLDKYEHVFVVDNSENPTFNDVSATVIQTVDSKIGFGAAVNFGVSQLPKTNYTHILILNQDAFFAAKHFKKLLEYLKNNPIDAFLSPMIYTERFDEVMPFIAARYFPTLPTRPIGISDFVAVSLVVSQPLFEELNGFDTNFYMYYEDTDLIKRSGKAHPVRILPHVHVGHRNEELDGKEMSVEKRRWIQTSKLYYLKKHGYWLKWAVEKLKSSARS